MVYLFAIFQPTIHRIANVMANIRYRPAIAAVELTGPGAERSKNFKNVYPSSQFFIRQMTMQINRYPKGSPKKYTKVPNSNIFRPPVGGWLGGWLGGSVPPPPPKRLYKKYFLLGAAGKKELLAQK